MCVGVGVLVAGRGVEVGEGVNVLRGVFVSVGVRVGMGVIVGVNVGGTRGVAVDSASTG